jgi:DNA-binding transcriptional LysR family regulator
MLDWDDLRLFLALARSGTLTAAARTLEVTQPTVGRRIAAFEKRLGAKLFEPTPTRHVLTSTGRRLLEYAARMEAEALSAERVARGRDTGLSGRVTITGSEWVVQRLLGPMVGPLVARHPGLEIELLEDPRPLSLVRREADIAVRPSRFEHQDVVELEVAVVAFGLYASDGYLAERGTPDFSRQCLGHALIGMSESFTTIADVQWLPRIASRARVVARANGRMPMAALAAAGVGLACLPRIVGDGTPSLHLLRTPSPGPERRLWIAAHRDTRGVPRIRSTLAFLKDALRRARPALSPPLSR